MFVITQKDQDTDIYYHGPPRRTWSDDIKEAYEFPTSELALEIKRGLITFNVAHVINKETGEVVV